jgi:hypothetical protein
MPTGLRPKPPIGVTRDGREICNIRTRKGKVEYEQRKHNMHQRQKGRCCLQDYAPMCPGPLRLHEATFEHEHGRGGGKRDDRIVLPDGTWINGVAHAMCNCWKGSRYIDYNRSFQK